ncbi:MAG: heavy metal sensor histidine kinase [Bryobacteraceae bacterium]
MNKRQPELPTRESALRRIPRGLRFRLTLSYVFFFALVLSGVGIVFRSTLSVILESQTRQLLEDEWGAIKGYLRIERRQPIWFFDREDPEEAFFVERLRRVYLLTDAEGRVLEVSNGYLALGVESPEEIRSILAAGQAHWSLRWNARGDAYLVRAGALLDERRPEYFMAIGRPLSDSRRLLDEFTFKYFAWMPVMLGAGILFGWFFAGRALQPVNDLAKTAERISGTNLSLRISPRGAGDELDHLIGTFNNMIERLEAAFQQSRQFSADVSHELRTPLTAIRGQLEVALFTARTSEEYRAAMEDVLQDVERVSQIVKILLLLSQAEAGHLTLQVARMDLSATVRDLVEQFQIPAEEGQVRLLAQIPAECPVQADRIQIERLLSNLLSNAVKYTPAGGSVTVRVRELGSWIELSVEDSGIGIPAEHLPHIFDRFYRVPGAEGKERGFGLGLSFVSWIVKAHGGKISVESAPGKGTRLVAMLPIATAPPQSAETAKQTDNVDNA